MSTEVLDQTHQDISKNINKHNSTKIQPQTCGVNIYSIGYSNLMDLMLAWKIQGNVGAAEKWTGLIMIF